MSPVRALTPPESEAFRLARLVAGEHAPYFLTALFAATPCAAPGLGTFGVDDHWRLYMDPDLLVGPDRWDVQDVAGVLLHEVGHLIRDHAGRRTSLPAPAALGRWNIAGDCEINDDLLAAGIPLPGSPETPAAHGLPDGQYAEWYYEHLPADSNGRDGGDDDGCGSGAGSAPLPGEGSGDDTQMPPVTHAEGDLLRRQIARSVLDHAGSKGRGTIPAGLTRWASDTLAPPTIPWQRVLRAAVRRAIAFAAGQITHTYTRPSRRRVPKVILPAMRAPKVTVSVVIDTSGSMGQDDLDAALRELAGVMTANGVDREGVTLVTCDAAATAATRLRSLRAATLTGGGGTDMRIGITAALAARPRPDVIVVLTDGYTPWPDRRIPARLICGIINAHETPPTPPWATTVSIAPSAGNAP